MLSAEDNSKAEDKIQQEIFIYYNNTFCLKHHNPRRLILSIPNEGKQSQYLTRIGLYPGAADLIVFHNTPVPVFIEVKTPIGKQSPKQIQFEAHVLSLNLQYYIVRSLDEFKWVLGIA